MDDEEDWIKILTAICAVTDIQKKLTKSEIQDTGKDLKKPNTLAKEDTDITKKLTKNDISQDTGKDLKNTSAKEK